MHGKPLTNYIQKGIFLILLPAEKTSAFYVNRNSSLFRNEFVVGRFLEIHEHTSTSQSMPLRHSFILITEYFSVAYSRDFSLCGVLVRVPGYRSRGPASIPGTTRFSEK
jgi:hypothetical protein